MKKKKGFTLVELLAVIVVLDIIALIAVPTILGVIEKARKSSLQDSGYGLVEAANLYYAQYQNGKTVRFDIEDNQIITEEENKLNYKGTVKNGTVLINQKGEVTICINDGNHAAYKNYQDTRVTVVDKKTCTIPENKYVVYLDDESTINSASNEELLSRVEELESKVAALESDKASQAEIVNLSNQHTNDINTLNIDLSSFNSRLTNLTTSINTINSTLNKYIYVSYTDYSTNIPIGASTITPEVPSVAGYNTIYITSLTNTTTDITINSANTAGTMRIYNRGTAAKDVTFHIYWLHYKK